MRALCRVLLALSSGITLATTAAAEAPSRPFESSAKRVARDSIYIHLSQSERKLFEIGRESIHRPFEMLRDTRFDGLQGNRNSYVR